LLLGDVLEDTRYADDVYDDDKLLKTKRGFGGYEEWEESFEQFYVEEMLSAAVTGNSGG